MRLDASKIVRVIATGLAAIAVTSLSGCFVWSYKSNRQDLPDMSSRLPEQMRASDEQVLVLAQYTVTYRYPKKVSAHNDRGWEVIDHSNVIKSPLFLKAKELNSANQTLEFQADLKTFGFLLVSPMLFPYAGVTDDGSERLDTLCVTTADGTSIMFLPDANTKTWSEGRQEVIYPDKRDAIVNALEYKERDEKYPLEGAGPCGIVGYLSWSKEERGQVIAFLTRIPRREKEN